MSAQATAPSRAASQGHIRISNISKSFGSTSGESVLALDSVDCTIEEGSFVSIVGPSGCGKTTLLRMVAGLMQATHGTVSIDGQVVTGTRRDVGVVFQSSILLPWRTVIENVLLPAEILRLDMRASRQRAMDLLRLVKLEGFENKLPRQLSGGMQQRASIARALLHDPKVLLMDEPFGALDALTREKMNLELQRIWMESGKTVILITHSIPEAIFLGDRVFVMTPRPGALKRVIKVDLPRPRDMSSMGASEFVRVSDEIREIFSHSGNFD